MMVYSLSKIYPKTYPDPYKSTSCMFCGFVLKSTSCMFCGGGGGDRGLELGNVIVFVLQYFISWLSRYFVTNWFVISILMHTELLRAIGHYINSNIPLSFHRMEIRRSRWVKFSSVHFLRFLLLGVFEWSF